MELIPAFDLRDGRCVRLLQGDFERETRYSVDPVDLAERYREELRAEIPEIDVVLGTGELPGIVDAVGGVTPKPAAAVPLTLYRGRNEITPQPDPLPTSGERELTACVAATIEMRSD